MTILSHYLFVGIINTPCLLYQGVRSLGDIDAMRGCQDFNKISKRGETCWNGKSVIYLEFILIVNYFLALIIFYRLKDKKKAASHRHKR